MEPTRRSRRRNLALSIAPYRCGAAAGPIRGVSDSSTFPFLALTSVLTPWLYHPLFLFSPPKFDPSIHCYLTVAQNSKTRERVRIIHRISALKREWNFPGWVPSSENSAKWYAVHSRHRFSSLTPTAPTNWVDFGAPGVSVPCCSPGCLYIVGCFVANSVDNITRNSRESFQNQANQVVISLFNNCLGTSLGFAFKVRGQFTKLIYPSLI